MKFKYTDYHVHTDWSHDIMKDGPSFQDYVTIAERNRINICFLNHYELYYIENDPTYPFYGGKLENYLEELDRIKENHEFVLSGLEVDYYEDREDQLREFMDDYEKQFDFIAGTLHETDYGYPVTTREKLLKLLQKKRIKNIVDEFFVLSEKMIKSRIFRNVCHLDTIFRYINRKDLKPSFDIDVSHERVLNLGRICIENDVAIEYNLSGRKYKLKRPFPAKSVIKILKNEGAKVFVGSDSHSTNYFRAQIRRVKKAYKVLERVDRKKMENSSIEP